MSITNFRHDINVLRALSVAIVVLFHFRVPGFSAGFIGVDIFFAISGYLMTSIICRGIDSGNFNIWGFYKARFNRLYPALGMMLIIVLLFCIFTITTSDLLSAGKNALSSAFFISNFYYYSNSGYFDQSSLLNWFLHTWSLSVEWQFYLLYPMCLILWKAISGKQSHLILALLIASFLASSLMNYDNKDAGYYLLHTRAWELLTGGLSYFFSINSKTRLTAISGWVLIIMSIIFIPSDAIWPGHLAIFPVVGACLILASKYNDNFLPKMSVVNNIGLWSYSIYLWHWPVVVLLYVNSKSNSIYFISLGVAASLFLGWLSYRFIETLRFSNRNSIMCLSSGFVIVALSMFVISTNGMKYRLNNSLSEVLNYKMSWVSQRNGKCFLAPNQRPEDFKLCPDEPTKGYTLIWGDSHAAQLIPGFEERDGGHSGLVQRTASLCLPVVNIDVKSRPHCRDINSYVMNEIKLNPPSKVILAASWTSPSYNGIKIKDSLDNTIKLLQDAGVNGIYVIGTVPVWRDALPKLIERKGLESIPTLDSEYVTMQSFIIDAEMKEYFKSSSAKYLSIIDILCNNNKCLTIPEIKESSPMQWDNAHLTEPGSVFVVSHLQNQMR